MTLLPEKFQLLVPDNHHYQPICEALNKILPAYGIMDNKQRLAMFIGQCSVESIDFTVTEENLMYRASALMRSWPAHFPTLEIAKQYEFQPEKIANRAYAGHMENGDEASGDGWKFHGRGFIQLTGKKNYKLFAASLGMTIDQVMGYLDTYEGAVESACWYWKMDNINAWADKGDVVTCTHLINGGENDLDARRIKYNKALSVL